MGQEEQLSPSEEEEQAVPSRQSPQGAGLELGGTQAWAPWAHGSDAGSSCRMARGAFGSLGMGKVPGSLGVPVCTPAMDPGSPLFS